MSQPSAPTDRLPDLTDPEHLEFRSRTPLWLIVLKWLLLAVLAGVLVYVSMQLAEAGHVVWVVLVAFVGLCVLAVYGTRRAVPLKYLLPGLLLMLTLQIWPLAYTVALSFTNYGDGHMVTKEEAIGAIEANSVRPVEGSARYQLNIAVPEGQDPADGDLVYLLTDPDGVFLAGDLEGVTELDPETVETGLTGRITSAEGFTVLSASEVNARTADLNEFAVPTETGGIKAIGLSEAFIGEPTKVYDPETDTVTDTLTGTVYVAEGASFVPQDGQGARLPQGWQENVGFDNYTRALTDPVLRDGFIKVFVWNVAFALITVGSTFLLGMALALLMNDERLKGKGIYRSLLILPYALPVYVTALVWASMFNQDFGLINDLTGLHINWLGDGNWARFSLLLTNLWLGFPYMFIVCTGALQAIPNDVREAAQIDGAGPLRTVRSVIMPLLLVAVGPLLIASFAFNFNNFGLIYLMTEGGPFEGGQSQVGSTDLLITWAFRLALGGTQPNFGLASAIAVFIFIIVALISYEGFRRTKALEDVN
ncbi:ABC transporter permease subunit [Ornithinicoccus hortensis]|uniref:Maltose/maltodextrin transport system permease protein n=1 Tax=Ornithinicoccus hortensis TaxID=82346 RepID=A0A542YP19_9MICO|nr:ABC transporter permease subunit [Ornithinicoccus hortensis]TQL49855.1 carbohydrate ABC transporter membrane protein 1 (CUT1 family) [Ornithinicoccus hortensis]